MTVSDLLCVSCLHMIEQGSHPPHVNTDKCSVLVQIFTSKCMILILP